MTTSFLGQDLLPQSRHIVTAIPGPKSAEAIARRKEAVSGGLSMAFPAVIARAEGAIMGRHARVVVHRREHGGVLHQCD